METENLEQKRLFERSRYEALYTGKVRTKPHKKWYGIRNHGREAWPKLRELRIRSLVDVGTGNGGFPRQAVENGISRVAGVDFALDCLPRESGIPRSMVDFAYFGQGAEVSWFKASAHDLPFEDDQYEWLTSFDTLEHLIPEELDEVLTEFRRVASTGWFFSIAYHTSHTVMGSDLHLIVKPKEWWKEKLSEWGEVLEFTEKYLWLRF